MKVFGTQNYLRNKIFRKKKIKSVEINIISAFDKEVKRSFARQ